MNTILVGRYTIINKIGEGGLSEVFLVSDARLLKQWAMKRIKKHDERMNQKTLLMTFQKEFSILSKLNHRGIPRISDQFEDENYFYVVMDYIKGETLASLLSEDKNRIENNIQDWMLQIIDIFIYLHGTRPYPLLYLDLKPQNMICDENNNLYLIDFGTSCFQEGWQVASSATPRICIT
ncbi:MAG: protein kinase [Longicatena sp.]